MTAQTQPMIEVRCAHCGSERVLIETRSRWDKVAARWEARVAFPDNAQCLDCKATDGVIQDDDLIEQTFHL